MKIRCISLLALLFLLQSCNEDLDDCCGEEVLVVDSNPDNDPLSLGLINCGWDAAIAGKTIDYPVRIDLPSIYDLGYLMPQPGSQGQQGSCASWATHNYLGSYLLNIKNDSIISNNTEIMSPSFAFNQLKFNSGDCEGSSVQGNLELMINTGVLPRSQFPYTDFSCSRQPTVGELNDAITSVLTSYEKIGPYYEIGSNNEVIAPIVDELKSALVDGKPAIISMLVDRGFGTDRQGNVFIVNHLIEDLFRGCHAMTVVGFNDDIQAFRVLNSWGDKWANDGYVYVSYDFFRGSEHVDFKKGVLSLIVPYTD